MGMFGIAYAQRSPQGATRGRESCNLPRRIPAAWFSLTTFFRGRTLYDLPGVG
jgi:hypothetical protein